MIFFEEMYNDLSEEKIDFPWSYDKDLVDVRIEVVRGFVGNALSSLELINGIAENSF